MRKKNKKKELLNFLDFNSNNYIEKIKGFLVSEKVLILFFFVIFSSQIVWWLSFYPGVMTSDSHSQWKQALDFKFNNWHPYIYTLIVALLARLKSTPAMMGLFQILVYSSTIGCFLGYVYKKSYSKNVSILLLVIYSLFPVFGIYNVTIWKDVLYSNALLSLSLLFSYFIFERKERSRLLIVLISFIASIVASVRFNGLIYIFLPAFLLLIFYPALKKEALKIFFVTLSFFLFFSVILFKILAVQKTPMVSEQLKVKILGAAYQKDKPNITEKEREIIKRYITEESLKKDYSCAYANQLFFGSLSGGSFTPYKPLDTDSTRMAEWNKTVSLVALKNIDAVYYDRLCIAEHLLDIKPNPYLFSLNVESVKVQMVKDSSKLPEIRKHLVDYALWSTYQPMRLLFWTNWPVLLIFIGYLILSAIKKTKITAIYALLNLSNVLFLILITPAVDYRFIYGFYLSVFFLPVIYLIEIGKIDEKRL